MLVHCEIVEPLVMSRCVYKTVLVAELKVAVAESPSSRAGMRSVCVIPTAVDRISTDTERRAVSRL